MGNSIGLLCFVQWFLCCFRYNFLSKPRRFPMFPLRFCYNFLSKSFPTFPLLFCYTFLSKSMLFQRFLCCFVIPPYLNLCFFQCFLCCFVIPSYLNVCFFMCFLCCFRYTFLSKSMPFPNLSFVVLL